MSTNAQAVPDDADELTKKYAVRMAAQIADWWLPPLPQPERTAQLWTYRRRGSVCGTRGPDLPVRDSVMTTGEAPSDEGTDIFFGGHAPAAAMRQTSVGAIRSSSLP